MSTGFIVPFRGRELGKTRLRARLPAADVDALSERMLANVLCAVRGASPAAPTVLITRVRAGLTAPPGVTIIEQRLDHNEAIEFARAHLHGRAVSRIAVIASDLPLIQAADISALLKPSADVLIAPDARQQGTNALVFPAMETHFTHFGAESARLHAAEAQKRRLTVEQVQTLSLAHDVDTVDQITGAVRDACAPARGRD